MKINKKIRPIITLIIIIYICTYYVANSGYYELNLRKKTTLTNEQIKKFEEDIKNNKDISINDYLENPTIDYTNNITNTVYKMSNNASKLTRKTIKFIFKKLSYLLED